MIFCKFINKTNIRAFSLIVYIFIIVSLTYSCNKDNLSEMNNIKLELPSNLFEQYIHSSFTFKVEGDNNNDITKNALIKVNEKEIEGNIFSSATTGEFNVQAFYKNFKSNIIKVKVVIPSSYVKKVLVEDYTGTWCGYCPRIAHAIELAKKQSDKIVPVAVHVNDELSIDEANNMKKEFGVNGLPMGKINRIHTWTEKEEHKHLEDVVGRTGITATLGVAINSNIIDEKININIQVGFDKTFTEQLAIVAYVTENKIIAKQTNYTDFFGGEKNIENFEHNDVLRCVLTNLKGNDIPIKECVEKNIYKFEITKPIPKNIKNIENLNIVSFVVNKKTQEVINVQVGKLGENKKFE